MHFASHALLPQWIQSNNGYAYNHRVEDVKGGDNMHRGTMLAARARVCCLLMVPSLLLQAHALILQVHAFKRTCVAWCWYASLHILFYSLLLHWRAVGSSRLLLFPVCLLNAWSACVALL